MFLWNNSLLLYVRSYLFNISILSPRQQRNEMESKWRLWPGSFASQFFFSIERNDLSSLKCVSSSFFKTKSSTFLLWNLPKFAPLSSMVCTSLKLKNTKDDPEATIFFKSTLYATQSSFIVTNRKITESVMKKCKIKCEIKQYGIIQKRSSVQCWFKFSSITVFINNETSSV